MNHFNHLTFLEKTLALLGAGVLGTGLFVASRMLYLETICFLASKGLY